LYFHPRFLAASISASHSLRTSSETCALVNAWKLSLLTIAFNNSSSDNLLNRGSSLSAIKCLVGVRPLSAASHRPTPNRGTLHLNLRFTL